MPVFSPQRPPGSLLDSDTQQMQGYKDTQPHVKQTAFDSDGQKVARCGWAGHMPPYDGAIQRHAASLFPLQQKQERIKKRSRKLEKKKKNHAAETPFATGFQLPFSSTPTTSLHPRQARQRRASLPYSSPSLFVPCTPASLSIHHEPTCTSINTIIGFHKIA